MRNASWIVPLSLVAASVLAQEKSIEPGLYEVTSKPSVAGAGPTRVCLTAKDIVDGLNPVPDKDCKRIRSVVAGGKLDFATTCPDLSMTMTGTYTSTSYVIDGKLTIKGDDDPAIAIESHIVGKRVAATCKTN